MIDAAKSLISEGKIDGATVEQIVRRAGVSRRSFHNHFVDRDDLIKHALRQVREELDVRLTKLIKPDDDPAFQLACGMLGALDYGMESQLSGAVLSQISPGVADPSDPGAKLLVTILCSGIERGIFDVPGLDAAVVLTIGLADVGMSQLLNHHMSSARQRKLMHGLCVVLLRGLNVDAGRAHTVACGALDRVFESKGNSVRRKELTLPGGDR